MSIHSAAVAAADAEAVLWSGMRTRILLNTAERQRMERARPGAIRRGGAGAALALLSGGARADDRPGVTWRAVSSTATTPRTRARCTTSRTPSPPTTHTTSCTATTPRCRLAAGAAGRAARGQRADGGAAGAELRDGADAALAVQADFADALALRAACLARRSPAAPCTRPSPVTARTRTWSAHCSSRRAIRAYCWSMP